MIKFDLIWFDSFGAKSSCTLVETEDISILIDPGIAVMHPSFPAPEEMKDRWVEEGYKEILEAAKGVNLIVVSHYHWDHFLPDNFEIYVGKTLFVKNPNKYINDSQRERAVEFFTGLFRFLNLNVKFLEPKEEKYEEPKLRSFEKDFGDYNKRRQELLEKGRKWFWERVNKWNKYDRIPEVEDKNIKIYFAEGKEFRFGKTKIRFTEPLFHGIEFSRVGWVFATIIECNGEKFIHTSDLNGPIIEDYADWIIDENPDYIILDGPPTYMIPYMFNLINLRRVIENMKRIIEEVDFRVLIWDHHLPREPRFRKRTKEVWDLAKKLNKTVLTAREYKFNKKPVVEELILEHQ